MSDPVEAPLVDRRHLDDYAAVLPAEQLRRLVEAFARELMTRPSAIRRLAQGGDVAAARDAAHLLRGAALNIGCSRIADLAGAVEAAAHDDVAVFADRLPSCAVATLAALQREQHSVPPRSHNG